MSIPNIAAPIEGGLLAYVAKEESSRKLCIFARARASLSETHREELDYMVANPDLYSISVVARSLNAVGGVSLSRASVDTHLKEDCRCHR